MCGIAGFFDKKGKDRKDLGKTMLGMLQALECRGPDSSGAAMYRKPVKGQLVARVQLSEKEEPAVQIKKLKTALGKKAKDIKSSLELHLLRLVFSSKATAQELAALIEVANAGSEVLSLGSELEIVKQVGFPEELERDHSLSAFSGSHAIGHTRLSTESRIDISHSQPFWSHGVMDLATVHNGHITNYNQMRRQYEGRGFRFYTENDSELVGVYLADQLHKGLVLREALEKSMKDFDGSFCYLVANADTLGYVKDSFALKPLVVGETDDFVAIATEEIALRKVFPKLKEVREADAQSIHLWTLNGKN
jgi:glutamate synthase domain-containing protein 1